MNAILLLILGAALLTGGATAGLFLGQRAAGTAALSARIAAAGLGTAAAAVGFVTMDPATLASLKFALVTLGGNLCHCLQ